MGEEGQFGDSGARLASRALSRACVPSPGPTATTTALARLSDESDALLGLITARARLDQLPWFRRAEVSGVPGSNYYVFCLSRALEHRLLLDFDSDCCLVVTDVDEFSRRLTTAMNAQALGWVMRSGEIRYYDPVQAMPGQVELPFSKHFRYAYQREFRFAWLPPTKQDVLDPIFVELGDLSSIAELVFPKS